MCVVGTLLHKGDRRCQCVVGTLVQKYSWRDQCVVGTLEYKYNWRCQCVLRIPLHKYSQSYQYVVGTLENQYCKCKPVVRMLAGYMCGEMYKCLFKCEVTLESHPAPQLLPLHSQQEELGWEEQLVLDWIEILSLVVAQYDVQDGTSLLLRGSLPTSLKFSWRGTAVPQIW
jgi:hypothetical protein